MENNIQVFENSEFGSVRVVEQNGEPWFVAKDVAERLGYSNPRKAIIDHVDEEDKMDGVTIRDSIGREQSPMFINESGLYSLVLSSKLPGARKFKRWVTSDVIPAVRKHGAYFTPATLEAAFADPSYLLQLTAKYKEEFDKRKALEQKVSVLAPKASYCDAILRCEEAVTVTTIAKDYGMSATAFNKKLSELGIQYKQGGVWFPYQKYASEGYTKSETYHATDEDGKDHARVLTKWTQKGRLFLYEQLRAAGILPCVERMAA